MKINFNKNENKFVRKVVIELLEKLQIKLLQKNLLMMIMKNQILLDNPIKP